MKRRSPLDISLPLVALSVCALVLSGCSSEAPDPAATTTVTKTESASSEASPSRSSASSAAASPSSPNSAAASSSTGAAGSAKASSGAASPEPSSKTRKAKAGPDPRDAYGGLLNLGDEVKGPLSRSRTCAYIDAYSKNFPGNVQKDAKKSKEAIGDLKQIADRKFRGQIGAVERAIGRYESGKSPIDDASGPLRGLQFRC